MLSPVELRTGGGRIIVGPVSMRPAYQRTAFPPIEPLSRIFRDPDSVGQLRRAWPKLGLGGEHTRHLTSAKLRERVEQAIAADRIALLWIPAMSDVPIQLGVDRRPKAPPQSIAAGSAVPPPRKPAPSIGSMTAQARIELALDKAFALLGAAIEAKTALRHAVEELARDEAAVSRIGAFFALLARPGIGEATARPLLAHAFHWAGLKGVAAVLSIGTASFEAANATDEATVDLAARRYAESLGNLGLPIVDWLSTQLQTARSKGGRVEPAEAGVMSTVRKIVDDPASIAKILKDEAKSYSAQVLAKYEAAANQAKSDAEDALLAGVTQAVTDVAGDKVGAAAGALLDKAKAAADEEIRKAADAAEARVKDELKKAEDEARTIVTEEGLALIERYLSDEEIAALKRIAGEEMIERLRAGETDPEDLEFYKQQLIAGSRAEAERAARDALEREGVPELPAF